MHKYRQLGNRSWPLTALCLAGLFAPIIASARQPKEATLTSVINDVRLLGANAENRSAANNEKVPEGTEVRTGPESFAELTFGDETRARLSSNTAVSFKNGSSHFNLREGAVLVDAPKRLRGARIDAGNVAAAVAGTTVMFELHPGMYKFLVLRGLARLNRPGHLGDSLLVRPGQLVIGDPSAPLADAVDFDIERFVKTSRLITNFAPLRSEPLMAAESQAQLRNKSKRMLIDTNLVIFGGGTHVSLTNPAQTKATSPAPVGAPEEKKMETPAPQPSPSEPSAFDPIITPPQ